MNRNALIFTTCVLWTAMYLNAASVLGTNINSNRHPQIDKEKPMLVENAQRLLELSKAGRIDPSLTITMSYRLWGEVEVKERLGKNEQQHRSTAESRGEIVRTVLGTNLYSQLETYFIESIQKYSNVDDTVAALNILGKGLSSKHAEKVIENALRKDMRQLTSDEAFTPNPSVLLARAEALAYLDNAAGVEVLDATLASQNASSADKRIAIRAVAVLPDNQNHAVLLHSGVDLLCSEDSALAFDCFLALETKAEFGKQVQRAAEAQLARLARLAKNDKLTFYDLGLLRDVSLILQHACEKEGLSFDDRQRIKDVIKGILSTGKSDEGQRVAPLFSILATNDDVSAISGLIHAPSPRERTEGVKCLMNCNYDVQRTFIPELIGLLDDDDRYTRDLSLYVLRRFRGEHAANLLPEKTFKEEARRIKIWWQGNNDAKGFVSTNTIKNTTSPEQPNILRKMQ